MWKNILYFIIGALIFSVLIDRPIFAKEPNLSSVGFAISGRELAIFDREDGVIYYYNKQDGKLLRIHKFGKLGANMQSKK